MHVCLSSCKVSLSGYSVAETTLVHCSGRSRKTGFKCPRGCGKGTKHDAPCPGKVGAAFEATPCIFKQRSLFELEGERAAEHACVGFTPPL